MKKSITVMLVISLICSMVPFAVFAEDTSATFVINSDEMKKTIVEHKADEAEYGASFTASEVRKALASTDGIYSASCREKEVDVDNAVNEIFDSEHQAKEATRILTSKAKGEKYTIEVYDDKSRKIVRTYSENGKYMSIIELKQQHVNVDSYTYENQHDCFINRNIKFTYSDDTDSSDEFLAQAIKYGKKTKSATWNKKTFWYANGSKGKKTYLKIGQKASYRIRTDNLSNKKEKKCDSYRKAVKKSKSYWAKGTAEISGTTFSVGIIVGLIIANAACPPSVIVDIVIAAIGGGSIPLVVSGVKNLVNSYEKWEDSRDYYVTIRTYGTKL